MNQVELKEALGLVVLWLGNLFFSEKCQNKFKLFVYRLKGRFLTEIRRSIEGEMGQFGKPVNVIVLAKVLLFGNLKTSVYRW